MKKKKWLQIVLGCIGVNVLLVVVNFIPTWSLKTGSMHQLEGNWVDVYYEEEVDAAEDVFQLADSKAAYLAEKLGFTEKQDVKIYIYDQQSTMQTQKYGLIGPLLGLDWYVGDNIGTNVILTSPANPGKVHDYDNNKEVVLHEMVHAYISVLNPKVELWLTEGVALYLTNGEPFQQSYLEYISIPSYSDIKTRNPMKFSKKGGYTFAHTYIEYLDVTYGWEKVLELLKTGQYESIYGKSANDIYLEWVDDLLQKEE